MALHQQLTATIFILMFTWLPSSYAIGLGLSLGSGTENWENDPIHTDDREISNYGFIFDTAVAKNHLFNYRLSLLFEKNYAKNQGLNMEGTAFTNDFVFGVLRTESVRLWVGPQLRISYYRNLSPNNIPDVEYSGSALGVGTGPVIGINVNLPKVVTLSASASYMLLGHYSGDYGIDVINTNGRIGNNTVDAEFSGFFANISIIFRINDEYQIKK